MTKFYGVIGYSEGTVEQPAGSGVWVDVVIERSYFGDVVRNTRQVREADKVNNDISVNNSISVVGDPYAYQNFFAMRYISWNGTLWTVSDVDVQRPRLILQLGGVYHGPTPTPSESP